MVIQSLLQYTSFLLHCIVDYHNYIACNETPPMWVGTKSHEIHGYKLRYSGHMRSRNGVDILVDKELVDGVVEVRRKNDRIMSIKLVVGVEILNVICVYAPQVGLADEIKREFSDELEEVIQGISQSVKLFLGGILMAISEQRWMGTI